MWVIDVIKSAIFWGVTAAKFFFIDHPIFSFLSGVAALSVLAGVLCRFFDSSGR